MLNSKDIHSPCQSCAIRGHTYSPNDTSCQKCEYNIAIQILKRVLKDNDYCKHCKNREYHRGNYGGYYDCKFDDKDFVCVTERDFVINWDSVFEEYGGI